MKATQSELASLAMMSTAGRNPARNANFPREGLDRRVNADQTRGNDTRPRPGGNGPAARRFWSEVDKRIRAGKTVQQAIGEVATNDPALHQAFVAEANQFFRGLAARKEGAR
jgi:hypothetical protein